MVPRRGDVMHNTIHFDTTRANIKVRGAEAADLAGPQAYGPESDLPFKGNMEVQRLDEV